MAVGFALAAQSSAVDLVSAQEQGDLLEAIRSSPMAKGGKRERALLRAAQLRREAEEAMDPVPFDQAAIGMLVTMTPYGCAAGRDYYSGVVVAKDADSATVRWNDPFDGGPAPRHLIEEERAEPRWWWDGEGRAHVPLQGRTASAPLSAGEDSRESTNERPVGGSAGAQHLQVPFT